MALKCNCAYKFLGMILKMQVVGLHPESLTQWDLEAKLHF